MSDRLARLFHEYDRGRISRRQLLQALGLAVAVRPIAALAQGQGQAQGQAQGGAAGRQGQPADTTPRPLPFAPTGWKTVLLDHFSCQVADYPKEAAYYPALMNWKIRSDDGKQAVLDIGDWGGLVLRGGYVAPPAPPVDPRRGRSGRRSRRAGAVGRARRGTPSSTASAGASTNGMRRRSKRSSRRAASIQSPTITATSRASTSRIPTASICRSATAT